MRTINVFLLTFCANQLKCTIHLHFLEYAVRLVNENGDAIHAPWGRVEVSNDAGLTWATVCDDTWDDSAAT